MRDQALAHLRSSSGSSIEAPAYVEGLISYYEGDLPTALAKVRQAYGEAEWLYEARKLGGDIHLEQGTELADGDAPTTAWVLAHAGPTTRALGTGPDDFPASIGPPDFPLGIIAGYNILYWI